MWTFRTQGKIDGSPVLSDGKVVFGSSDGRIYLVDAESGAKLWSYDLGGAIEATPAVWNGMVLVGTSEGVLHAFGPPTQTQPPNQTKAQP